MAAKVPTVLLITDKYGTSEDGMSTINSQVGQIMTAANVVVYSTALRVNKRDQEAADRDGVTLIGPVQLDEESVPTLDWLTHYHSVHYPHLPTDVTCIIGHAGITDTAARNIWEQRYPQADLMIITDVLPEDTVYFKGSQKGIKALEKEKDMLDKVHNTKAAFSVGPHIYYHFKTKYRGKKKPRDHFMFLPRPSGIFKDAHILPGANDGEKVVLTIGRVKNVEDLKGYNLAARSIDMAAKDLEYLRWVARGISQDDFGRSLKILEDNLDSSNLIPTLLPYGTQEDISNDMMMAHLVLMPSRTEPFGLVGLEAIAAGIPVLISDKTGLADMIMDLIKQGKINAEHRHIIVETSVNDSDQAVDAKRWADRIVDNLRHSDSEFEKAARFKRELFESRYWEESHRTLVQACWGTGTADVPFEIQLRGPAMAMLYSQACRQGSLPVHSARAQVVGQYRSGKTCFIKRLMGETVIEEEVEPITDGINIIPDVQTKTWKKSRAEIDDLAATLLRTQQKPESSAEEEYKNDDMAETVQQETETIQQETENVPDDSVEVVPAEQLPYGANVEEDLQSVRPDLPTATTEKPATNLEGTSENPKPSGSIPDSVIESAEKMTKAGITEDELGTADHPRLSFWDFGGQATYYGTHHCFITPRGVYILVMSLLQKLSDPVPDLDYKASVDNLRTGADYLDHWLNSVYSHTQQHARPPPVIVVLTNKDKFSKDPDYIEQYKQEILSHIEGKAAGRLVDLNIFAVDNTTEDAAVDEIRDYIRQVARSLPHMGEQIPISWLHLKSRLTKRREEGDRFLKFQEIAKISRDSDINITDKHTLATVLTFFHDRGDIIFFDEPSLRDDVTLQPQVMIDAFKTIITVPEYQQGRQTKAGNKLGTHKQEATKKGEQTGQDLSKMWENLERKGVLSDELLTRIWEEKDRQLEKTFLIQHKAFLKALMEKFYLICNATPIIHASDEGQQIYFVPALLSCERDNTELYPSNMHSCPQALYFVFSEKFLPSGMFCRLQALCVRRFGLEESRVFAGCARFPTDDKEQAFVITKVNHYLKVELLSSSNIFTEGLRVRKFLSSALFEIKEKWIPCIQYELCCSTQEDGDEPAFLALQTGEESQGRRWGFPPLFRAVWMSEGPQSDLTENSGGDGPVILQPKGDPNLIVGMRTIGPVLDTMEQGGGLTLDQCDHVRNQLTPFQRVRAVLEMKKRGDEGPYLLQLGAAVAMCLPEFEDLFRKEERGKALVILHTDDYTAEFASPLKTAMSESGVPCHTEIIASSDSITEKTVQLLLNTNNKMVLPVISPQTLHHQHWSNLAYEFPVRNGRLLLPILLYPRGSRHQMIRVLQRRAPVLCSMEREEMKGGLVSKRKLKDILQKVMIDKKEEAILYRISKAVVSKGYTRLGQELGLEKSVLDEIKGDDATKAAIQTLKAWRIKTPHGPLHYLPQLEEALRNIARPDLASAVEETYKEYRNGVELRELSPDKNEDKTRSLRLPGEGKYLCRRTDLGVVTPYPLQVTYKSVNWSDKWQEVGEWMPVGPLFSIQCEDVEGLVDILLPHVLHLTENTEITIDDLQVVHVVGDSVELLPVTELTPSHAVTRFKKGSLFGLVGRTEKVFSVSRNCLLMAFRSLDDSDLSTLKVYIVSNTKEITETLTEDEKRWNFEPCGLKTCHLSPGDLYSLEGSVTNGGSEMVSISPQRLMFEDTLDKNKFYEPFEVEVTADIWMDNTTRLHLELLKETTEEGNETQPLSQLTLGRYKRSQLAEGVDSGHSTPTELESVTRQLESARLTADDDTGASGAAEHLHRESGLAGAESEVDVKESHIKTVLKEASSKWEDLALELGFNANEIDVIRDLKPDQTQMCREMLTRWRNRKGCDATLQVLKQALIVIEQGRVAEILD